MPALRLVGPSPIDVQGAPLWAPFAAAAVAGLVVAAAFRKRRRVQPKSYRDPYSRLRDALALCVPWSASFAGDAAKALRAYLDESWAVPGAGGMSSSELPERAPAALRHAMAVLETMAYRGDAPDELVHRKMLAQALAATAAPRGGKAKR